MGHSHHISEVTGKQNVLPRRTCLRKGCQQIFLPRRWNQRYCQEEECLRKVQRWLARKRQRQCRQSEEQRERHRLRESARRAQHRQVAAETKSVDPPPVNPLAVTVNSASRGHAAKQISGPFCDRPGCYGPVCSSSRAKSCYCGDRCRTVMRRVFDRERKWLRRNTDAGRFKRQLEYRRLRQLRFADSMVKSPSRE